MFRLIMTLFVSIFFISGQNACATQAEIYNELDRLAIEAGTDKSSLYNHYTKIYAKIFFELKDKPIKMLEIGIYKGSSARMWENFFTVADLYFMDISDSNIEYWPKKAQYFFLDQSNERQLREFIEKIGNGFDIIIDDGGHTMNQQITSFNTLFPTLKSGGIYVIEDLCTSYWREYGGLGSLQNPRSGRNSTTEFLKNLTDDLHYFVARKSNADFEKMDPNFVAELKPYQKTIESMTFYPNMCVIIKR